MKHDHKYEYGCVMGVVEPVASAKIQKLNGLLIPEESLYLEEGQEFGREKECHITIKFGLTEHYKKDVMGKVVGGLQPFKAVLESIDLFRNPKFDVVKFNVKSDVLERLNKMFSRLPNKDEHPIYKPHLTLAYVKPGEGKKFIKELKPFEVSINRIKYSNPEGKYYYDL